MKIFLFFIGGFLGILVALVILFFFIWFKFKKFASSMGYSNTGNIRNMIKEGEYNQKYREKSISGLTDVLTPKIMNDYPNFNVNELFNKVETSLRGVFRSIESAEVSDIKELSLIKNILEETIKDNKQSDILEDYDDVVFHKHALKNYENIDGCLTITVASSVEYFYTKTIKNKIIEEYKDYKKQTAYITKYVYIYDPDKYEQRKSHLSAHCPNCGAPLRNFKDNVCDYCKSNVEPLNLKFWFLSEFKEKK